MEKVKLIINKLFFILWLRMCQVLGLTSIEFDKKEEKFYLWKFSNVYCIVIGTFVAIMYPYVLSVFGKLMATGMTVFSFTVFVSMANQLATYVFTILSYFGQHKNRFKIRNTLNDLVYFYRASKQTYKEFEDDLLGTYQRDFFMSVFLKTLTFVVNFLGFSVLLTGRDAPSWFFFVAFPYVTAMAICNQFFLGILVVNYFLATINRKCKAILASTSYYHEEIDNAAMEEKLLKASYVHSIMYKLHCDLSNYFGYQMMFNIFTNFFTVALTAFQICTSFVGIAQGYDFGFNVVNIIIVGCLGVTVLLIDIVFHMSISIRCSGQVSVRMVSEDNLFLNIHYFFRTT
jgi:hypothetical protein